MRSNITFEKQHKKTINLYLLMTDFSPPWKIGTVLLRFQSSGKSPLFTDLMKTSRAIFDSASASFCKQEIPNYLALFLH